MLSEDRRLLGARHWFVVLGFEFHFVGAVTLRLPFPSSPVFSHQIECFVCVSQSAHGIRLANERNLVWQQRFREPPKLPNPISAPSSIFTLFICALQALTTSAFLAVKASPRVSVANLSAVRALRCPRVIDVI